MAAAASSGCSDLQWHAFDNSGESATQQILLLYLQGTSTACILALEDDKLHAANLGDSGFIVVRKQQVLFKSPSQQHRFNFPYQLGCPGTLSDLPEHAEVQPMINLLLAMSTGLHLDCSPV